MDFKNILLLGMIVVKLACSSGSAPRGHSPQNTNTIGDKLQSYMPRYMLGMENTNIITAYDSQVKRIHQFDLATSALVRSFPVRDANNHNILAGSSGRYLIDIADGNLDLIKEDGTTTDIPLNFPGTPATAAFSPEEGIFAIVDEFDSIGLLEVADDGSIVNSWMGGSKLGEQSVALAGDVLSGARLVVSMSDKSLGIIDIKASMEQEKWVFEKTEAFASSVDWIARIPNQDDWIMATSQSSLFVYDVVSKAVISEQSLDGKQIRGRFRDLSPHVYMQDIANVEVAAMSEPAAYRTVQKNSNAYDAAYLTNQTVQAYTVNNDGVLSSYSLQSNLYEVDYSVLDVDKEILSVVEQSTVYRVRLSDNLVLTRLQSKSGAKTGITADYVFFQYDSALGYCEKASYEQSEEIEIIEGFNIEYL